MSPTEYLDAIKARYGLTSSYQLWKFTGWSKASIPNYYNRGGTFCDEHAIQVAEWLDIPSGEVLAAMAAIRAKTPAARAAWLKIAEMAHRAAVFVLAIAVVVASQTGMSAPAEAAPTAKAPSLYIM